VDDWAYSLFARAAWAHFYGDDHLSLASVQALEPLQKAGKADAAAKKLVAGYSSMSQQYLRYLDQVSACSPMSSAESLNRQAHLSWK
jgi:hypothetical protein